MFDDRVLLEQADNPRCCLIRYDGNAPSQVDVSVIDATNPNATSKGGSVVPIEAVFGLYTLLSGPFIALVVAADARLSGFAGVDFCKASKIALIPLFAAGRRLTAIQQRDEDRFLELLHAAFSQHQFVS